MSNSNKEIVEKFYTCFQHLDAEGMVSCYHKDIEFSDPAFGILIGEKACMMWRMLCERAKDFNLSFDCLKETESGVSAEWEAEYLFSSTGRKVHNKIKANFLFEDGLIIEHRDDFDLHRWASQALGWKGKLLGGTNFFRRSIQAKTKSQLERYTK